MRGSRRAVSTGDREDDTVRLPEYGADEDGGGLCLQDWVQIRDAVGDGYGVFLRRERAGGGVRCALVWGREGTGRRRILALSEQQGAQSRGRMSCTGRPASFDSDVSSASLNISSRCLAIFEVSYIASFLSYWLGVSCSCRPTNQIAIWTPFRYIKIG